MGVSVWAKDYDAASLGSVPGHLVQGNWPLLECLILDMVNIDAQGMSVLIKGNWPLLNELSMCDNRFTLAWLPLVSQAAAAWPLVTKLLSHSLTFKLTLILIVMLMPYQG